MPPRKRAKASAASTPLADAQPKTPQPLDDATTDLLHDPWADDQETQLFKSMMKWKPTGIHKHFRMISIHADMRSHGFATDDAPHTRIPGIWRKLHQLYDLRALDDRENSYAFGDDADPHDPEDAADVPEFELPEDDYGELIWQARFHGPESPAPSSPPLIPLEDEKALFHPSIGLLKDLPDGVLSQKVESAADAASAAASASAPKNTKNTRASRAAAKTGKAAKGQAAKSTRAQAAVSDSVEEEDDEEDDDEEDDDEEEESSTESEEEMAPTFVFKRTSTIQATTVVQSQDSGNGTYGKTSTLLHYTIYYSVAILDRGTTLSTTPAKATTKTTKTTMKRFLLSILAVFVAAAAVYAAPALPSDVEQFHEVAVDEMIIRRDPSVDCDDCAENLNVCLKYGFAPSTNIEHCADICSAFMCRKFPQCRKCDEKYNHCNPAHNVHL
ncbi:CT20-domain-containing protein [Periconia macrospinosa]|uniref:CT20-domain-containing protein n=1 Tax=Periconia macrospinosa TaxID=97972 RepID=A0A2V1EDS6_9PLEO|nr:CT20-domain-containing protein [Periconia macrospinosa]